MIKINRNTVPQVKYIGGNKTPIVVIDDYIENLNDLTKQVSVNGGFKPDEITNYPGIRSAMPKPIVIDYLQPVMLGLYKVFNLPETLSPFPKDNYFSLITANPGEISALQSLPHFDTPNPNLLAVIHYIGDGEHGGTGFFSHKKSGLERIDYENKEYFYECAQAHFNTIDTTNFSYCEEEHAEFSCYETIDYKPNRLIIFPGQLLHSTLVNLDKDIDGNPITGRLTANMFIEFK